MHGVLRLARFLCLKHVSIAVPPCCQEQWGAPVEIPLGDSGDEGAEGAEGAEGGGGRSGEDAEGGFAAGA